MVDSNFCIKLVKIHLKCYFYSYFCIKLIQIHLKCQIILIFAFIFSEYLHTLHAHCVLHTREGQKLWGWVSPQPFLIHLADRNFEDKFLPNRWTFFNKRVAFVHNFWFPATFITDKFWSDPPLRRSHRGDVFSILFQFIAPSSRRPKLWGQVSPHPLIFF